MKLPNGANAVISRSKLTDYLLSETHPVGKHKAKFFRKFGFDENNALPLVIALSKIARKEKVQDIIRYNLLWRMKTCLKSWIQ